MERFSYYGMRAILILYLVAKTTDGGMGFDRSDALSIYATYTGLVYLTPLIGGYLADKFLGARKAIFVGGILMMLGEMAMMFPGSMYLGLALLILGNGFFKPNISTIVGELYEPNDPRRDGAFTIFYMGINIGAFFSPLVCGTLAASFGFKWGFAAAAVGMGVGVIIFFLAQRKLGKAGFPRSREVTEKSLLTIRDGVEILVMVAGICAFAYVVVLGLPYLTEYWGKIPGFVKAIGGILILVGALSGTFSMAYKGGLKEGGKTQAISDVKAVAAILIISLFVIFFWLGFEQAGGTMTLFAEQETDRNLPVIGEIPAAHFQSINPIFIVMFAPIFSILWFKIDSSKYKISVVNKMAIGLVLLGLGFVLLYTGQQMVAHDDATGDVIVKANMMFLVGVYLLHTLGELCLSPIGLSLVTKLSPARMVSLMMGVWFLSSAAANYLAGNLEAMIKDYNIPLYLFLIGSSFAAAVLLFALSPLLKRWMRGN